MTPGTPSLSERLAALERRHAGGGSVPRPDVSLDTGPQTDEGEAQRLLEEHLGAEVLEDWRTGADGTTYDAGNQRPPTLD